MFAIQKQAAKWEFFLEKGKLMKKTLKIIAFMSFIGITTSVLAADVVPPVIDLPGTQPQEVGNFDNPGRCDNCHGGYDFSNFPADPAFGWKGSAMGNAGRDPIFWATLAIAEQDFDGAGDLCIRCHSAGGWIAGRSTPTDGSGLQSGDKHGIDCDTCHKSTNPDNSEHPGEMFEPFVANTPGTGEEGFYGSGILSSWGGNEKLGPYTADDAKAKHQRMQSAFHRSEDFCGTCHDVSNSAVGHYAPNHGTQPGQDANLNFDSALHGFQNPDGLQLRYNPRPDHILQTNEGYVGLNNPPYAYGIVERTYSEYKSSAFSILNPDNGGTTMPISNFVNLPADLQVTGGALELAAHTSAGNTYDDGSPRYFTCQSCHMRPITGVGANKSGTPIRDDLPVHDHTGGNQWVYPLVQYQDTEGTLRLGGGLDSTQIAAMAAGVIRAENSLRSTINMEVNGDTLRLTNLTGHKAITGYPEGRRMWLNIVWKAANGQIIVEDGKYGPLPGVQINYTNSNGIARSFQPESILDLHDPNTKIYEAHYAMTQEWAALLRGLNYPADLALSYDRETGAVDCTLGRLAGDAGTVPCDGGAHPAYHETFHFAVNNHVAKDNRIPPYGMRYNEAEKRNALPVPADQYGNPGPGSIYNHWDEYDLGARAASLGAASADITLFYQGTSWEYIQFLYLGNNGQNAFLGQEGVNMLDAWAFALDKNGETMVKPFAMATTTWGATCQPAPEICDDGIDNDCDGFIDGADSDCQVCVPIGTSDATCDGVDDNCDGQFDEDYAVTPTICGVGQCTAAGQLECQNGQVVDTCIEVTPSNEGPANDPTCSDSLDNDCDGLTDTAEDPDCTQRLCSDYNSRQPCRAAGCTWSNKDKVCM